MSQYQDTNRKDGCACGGGTESSLSAYKCMDALGCQFLHPGGRLSTKRLIEKLKISKNDKILEIGCGTGNTAQFIHSLTGATITGIDIDNEMIANAKKNTSSNPEVFDFKIGSGDDLPFEDNSFDVLISEGTTFFMDAATALKEYNRVLKSSGRMGLVEMSYFKQPTPELEALTEEVTSCYGIKPLQFDEWKTQIKEAGFILENVDKKNMNMSMWSMIQCEGFVTSMKMCANMLIKPVVANRMMSIMNHFNKYKDYFGYGIYIAVKNDNELK